MRQKYIRVLWKFSRLTTFFRHMDSLITSQGRFFGRKYLRKSNFIYLEKAFKTIKQTTWEALGTRCCQKQTAVDRSPVTEYFWNWFWHAAQTDQIGLGFVVVIRRENNNCHKDKSIHDGWGSARSTWDVRGNSKSSPAKGTAPLKIKQWTRDDDDNNWLHAAVTILVQRTVAK